MIHFTWSLRRRGFEGTEQGKARLLSTEKGRLQEKRVLERGDQGCTLKFREPCVSPTALGLL